LHIKAHTNIAKTRLHPHHHRHLKLVAGENVHQHRSHAKLSNAGNRHTKATGFHNIIQKSEGTLLLCKNGVGFLGSHNLLVVPTANVGLNLEDEIFSKLDDFIVLKLGEVDSIVDLVHGVVLDRRKHFLLEGFWDTHGSEKGEGDVWIITGKLAWQMEC
jgi:hypothetical protein